VVAYHIRLSVELKIKKYISIVILSDIDGFTLNKITSISKVLFTQNIYLDLNNQKVIKKYKKKNIQPLTEKDYNLNFLNKIIVDAPENSSNHTIANEWAIYRWAEFLKIESKAIKENREKITSMLYFKYLLAKNPIEKRNGIQFTPRPPKNSGTILYIDDEWAKGWSDILKSYFSKNSNIEFETFEYEFRDSNKFNIISAIKKKCKIYNPDLVLLDLRLAQSDHKTKEIEQLTGIRVTKIIKEINPAIQIVMLTATGKSIILENLYQHGILGYIKKEHPSDTNIKTRDNLNKLRELIDIGLEKSYLKEIWEIQNSVLKLKLFEREYFRQMKFEINSIFEILDSNMKKRYIYAMLSIHQALEYINNYYIDDRRAIWIDTKKSISVKNSTKYKILEVLHKKLKIYNLDNKIDEMTHLRNKVIHPNQREVTIDSFQIVEWFKMLQIILKKIEK
jgi:CheY-like chemotaxis protein